MTAPQATSQVTQSARQDVREFCRRLQIVAADLTEEQCAALQSTGILTALHRTLVAVRHGQAIGFSFVRAVKGFTDMLAAFSKESF